MERCHRLSTTGALVVCLIGSPLTGTVFAFEDGSPREALASSSNVAGTSDGRPTRSSPAATAPAASPLNVSSSLSSTLRALASTDPRAWQPAADFMVVDAGTVEAGGQYGRRGSRGRRNGTAAAVIALGAAASIAGGAVLVYANRPECSTNQFASGCGYGTKVVGGAVMSAGLVGIVAGALAWR